MGAPAPDLEKYAEQVPPTQIPDQPQSETTIEPSKTVPDKVDVVQDGKVIGSQG